MAWYLPSLTFWAFNTSEKVPSPFFATKRYFLIALEYYSVIALLKPNATDNCLSCNTYYTESLRCNSDQQSTKEIKESFPGTFELSNGKIRYNFVDQAKSIEEQTATKPKRRETREKNSTCELKCATSLLVSLVALRVKPLQDILERKTREIL